MTMTARVWAMLFGLSLLWGASFLFIAVAVREIPVLTLVLLRVGIAAAALWLYVRATGRAVPGGLQLWGAFAVMGFFNNVLPFTLIFWAQTQIPAGLASILNATTPIFTALVAGALLADERLTALRFGGVILGAAGAALVIGPELLAGLGTEVLAQGASLVAALSYAVSSVYGRRFRAMGVDPVVTALGMLTASAVMLVPVVALSGPAFPGGVPGMEAVLATLALALLSSAFAYVLFYRILAAAGTNVMLVTFLSPVAAILLGAALLGERLALLDLAGMAVIALGLLAIDGRAFRKGAGRA